MVYREAKRGTIHWLYKSANNDEAQALFELACTTGRKQRASMLTKTTRKLPSFSWWRHTKGTLTPRE